MNGYRERPQWISRMVVASSLIWLTGCGNSTDSDTKIARTPREAASQVEQAFAQATGETRQAAAAASEAMRTGDHEKAVVSLSAIRSGPDLTVQQGLAIHSSTVALEASLIRAADSGDEKARRAYELLKAMKRK
ncbi:MAG: hypothetical protein EXS31_13175 [Pedosphaera sp.]|nr:hypothetical protein [Pedosphaera sp.]